MESSESVSVDAVKESKKVNTYLGKRMQDGKNLPLSYMQGDYHKLSLIFEMYYYFLLGIFF